MRFRLKSILIVTTAACLLLAVAAPYIRQLDEIKQQRLLVACGVAAASTVILGGTFFAALLGLLERRLKRKLGKCTVVDLPESRWAIAIGLAAGTIIHVVALVSLIASYALMGSLPCSSGPDMVFLVFITVQSAGLAGVHAWRCSNKIGQAGIMTSSNRFLAWQEFEAVDYDGVSLRLSRKNRLFLTWIPAWKIACPPENAKRILELYENSKQSQDNTIDGDVA